MKRVGGRALLWSLAAAPLRCGRRRVRHGCPAIPAGCELRIVARGGKYHANVGGLTEGHNYIGATIDEALRGLDFYIEDREPYSALVRPAGNTP